MGNRAVITASKADDVSTSDDIGIYLHWNGGRDSVEGFLTYCKKMGYRPPDEDSYGWVCLIKVIANFFGDGLHVDVNTCKHLDCDNGDNGVYIIKGWDIVGRQYFEDEEQNNYPVEDFLKDIDACQPVGQRLYNTED